MAEERIVFTNRNNKKLSARLSVPKTERPSAYAIFAHCFTCNKNMNAVRAISKSLTEAGFAVLRFDFTGLGESEGDFEDTNFTSNVEDLLASARYLSEHHEAPSLLVGHSLGGAAVLVAGQLVESVQAIATIGAPASPEHVQHLFAESLEEIQKMDSANVTIGGRSFRIKKTICRRFK